VRTASQQIVGHEQSIRVLGEQRRRLDWSEIDDREEILDIARQITALRQQITAAQGQMASLNCPDTRKPGSWQLVWRYVGNTIGFGHAINDDRPFWIGDFNGDGRTDILFHFRGDLNWWLGSMSGNSLNWALVGTW
jgi:hypothetical protein